MVASETMQARQAALLLHGLPLPTREQVLAKLDAHEAARLKPLLAELLGLGVAPEMGRQLQSVATPRPAAPTSVEQLNAYDVAHCLQECSPATAAQLLRMRDWPWKAQVLGLIPEPRR